jgi:hypothetical protein
MRVRNATVESIGRGSYLRAAAGVDATAPDGWTDRIARPLRTASSSPADLVLRRRAVAFKALQNDAATDEENHAIASVYFSAAARA